MKVELRNHTLIVTREPTDPKIYGKAHGESLFLHKVKVELNKQGYDVIKKRMVRDRHLVDDLQHYIRSRNLNNKFQATHDFIQIYDPTYAIRFTYEDYNDGQKILNVTRGEPDWDGIE